MESKDSHCYMTTKEVAERLRVSEWTVNKMCSGETPELRSINYGGAIGRRITTKSVEEWEKRAE